jgi:predicted deacylase
MHVTHDSIVTLQLPYREELHVRRTSFRGGDGPRVAVIAGIHGDELEGLYVCHRLAAWLERLAETRPQSLRGRIDIIPAMNPLGIDTLERFVPVFDADLNRNFPGDREGLLPQRIAAGAMRALTGAALVIDIHASNIFLREIPQVRISQEFAEQLVPQARHLNLDVIWIHGAQTVLETTIAHSLNSAGIPCLVVEMGVGMRVTPVFTEQLLVGIQRVWQRLGVLADDLPLPPLEHEPLLADDGNVHYLNAETSGVLFGARRRAE